MSFRSARSATNIVREPGMGSASAPPRLVKEEPGAGSLTVVGMTLLMARQTRRQVYLILVPHKRRHIHHNDDIG
jgi:hypothetical protein